MGESTHVRLDSIGPPSLALLPSMERLRASDVRAILRFVGDTYAAPAGEFRLETLARLRALVPSDMTAWVETRVGRPEVEAIASPRDLLPDGPRRFARVRDEHPVLLHFERSRHGGAAKLSDFVGGGAYHRLRIYQEFFRPAGIEHQMSIALAVDRPPPRAHHAEPRTRRFQRARSARPGPRPAPRGPGAGERGGRRAARRGAPGPRAGGRGGSTSASSSSATVARRTRTRGRAGSSPPSSPRTGDTCPTR